MVELELGRGHHFRFTLTGLKGKTVKTQMKNFSKTYFREVAETFLNEAYKNRHLVRDSRIFDEIEDEAREMEKGLDTRQQLEHVRESRLHIVPFGSKKGEMEVHVRYNIDDDDFELRNHQPTNEEIELEKAGIEASIRSVERHHAAVKAIAELLIRKRLSFELHAFQNNEWKKIFEHKK